MPNDKVSFSHWHLSPSQLVQSANTEFLFNKKISTLNCNEAGLFEGNFFNFTPSPPPSYFKDN